MAARVRWFVFQTLAGLSPPYFADDRRLASLTDRHLRFADMVCGRADSSEWHARHAGRLTCARSRSRRNRC